MGNTQVSIESSPKEIKASFYAKAKRLHPDVAKHLSPEEAKVSRNSPTTSTGAFPAKEGNPGSLLGRSVQAHFVRLAIAYETLIDPTRRAEYILLRRRPTFSTFKTRSGQDRAPSWGGVTSDDFNRAR